MIFSIGRQFILSTKGNTGHVAENSQEVLPIIARLNKLVMCLLLAQLEHKAIVGAEDTRATEIVRG
ncbi:MAG: hypothetical protein VB960_02545 [Pseudohongiellaceae bacterium]|jgi:hypothetical protein